MPFTPGTLSDDVADQREIVGDVRRRHAEPLGCRSPRRPTALPRSPARRARVQQPDARAHELLKVLVARDDRRRSMPCVDALPRERADDVVGLVSLQRRESGMRYASRSWQMRSMPRVEVGLQLLGQLLARRLVRRIPLVAKADSPESCTQPRYSGLWVASSRWRKLTMPHAADVFSPRPS